MNTTTRSPLRFLLIAALGFTSAPLLAQDDGDASGETAGTAPAPGVEPEAQAVVDRMTAYLQGLKSFSISSEETRDEVLEFGYKLQNNQHSTVVVQRPNRMTVEVDGDIKNRRYVYDGSTLTIVIPELDAYAQGPVPGTIGELLGNLLARGVEMPMLDVLLQAFTGTLTEGVRAGLLMGESEIGGVPVDHLAFRQATIDWQLWVEQGERPLPRKILITTRYEVGDPQYQAVLTWDLKPKIGRDTFTFVPAKDSHKIEFTQPDPVAAGGYE